MLTHQSVLKTPSFGIQRCRELVYLFGVYLIEFDIYTSSDHSFWRILMYDKKIRERILSELQHMPFSHISEIARRVGTTRSTATKHLVRLGREGMVQEYKKGTLRLFILQGGRDND